MLGVFETVIEGVTLVVNVGDIDIVGVTVGVTDTEIDGVLDGVDEGDEPNALLGEGVIDIVGVILGVTVGVTDGVLETDIVGVTLGVTDTLGVLLGVLETLGVRLGDGGGVGNTGDPGMKLLIYYKAYINKGI